MISHKSWKMAFLLFALLGSVLVAETPPAGAQSTAHLTVLETGQSLTAGFNNTVTITVVNNYSGYVAIYDVGLDVSLPSGLTLVGTGGTWQFDSISYGQSVTVSFQVYAPSSSAGTSYSGTLTVSYKQLGDVSYTTETHSLAFSVTGYINLVVYNILLSPGIVTPGGNTTVSGNVLNNGNLASYNANVTVESPVLVPGPQNSVFLGEVDPTIPRPFSVLVVFAPGLAPGNYTITIKVSATDYNRPGTPIVGQGSAVVQVIKQVAQPGRGQTRVSVIGLIITFFRNLFNAFFGSSTG
ncbi:MAG TPA: NEW3 domain-containing protein [Candidatus Dormibacteraeota bacterium]|nr:NEW3 domain-containing protein [Candidatus Dormibacteraeota bacterium]